MKNVFLILVLLTVILISCSRTAVTVPEERTGVGTVPEYLRSEQDTLTRDEADIFNREENWDDGTSQYNEAENLINEGLTNKPGYD